MEEKNELNDIILNKSGSGSKSKKLLLAIAALTLILIIVLVIMNSLKSESDEQPPRAAIPPEPSAPTEIIDDPLFEPVEVIQEGSNTTASREDLGKIAQKIKQESFNSAPVQENVIEPASIAPIAPAAVQPKPQQPATVVTAPKAEPKPVSKPVQTPAAPKVESKPVAKPAQSAAQPAPKAPAPVVNTPTIKAAKPSEVKKVTAETVKPAPVAAKPAPSAAAKPAEKAAEPAPKAAESNGTYYIQVGSFTKQPNPGLYDRINASGLKYTNVPSGAATKVMIGPFKGEKAVRDALGTVRKNIEANAFIVKG